MPQPAERTEKTGGPSAADRTLFERAPIAIWEEDFTGVARFLDDLRTAGVEDLRRHFEAHPEALLEAVRRIHVRDVNQAAVELVDADSAEQLRSRLIETIDDDTFESFLAQLLAIWNGDDRVSAKVTGQTFTGRTIHGVLHWVAPHNGDGPDLSRVLVAISDTTELEAAREASRESASRYRLLIEQSPAPVMVVTPISVVYANRAAAHLCGTEDPALLVGTDGLGRLTEETRERFRAEVRDAIIGERALEPSEHRMQRDGDEVIDVEISGAPIRFEGRLAVQLLFRNITERKAAEEALRLARDRAEEATRLKTQFLANMSHEIRTPLNAVNGLTSMLLDTELQPDQRSYAETVRASGEALLEIVNQILDFARVDAGDVEAELQQFDLAETVETSIETVSAGAAQKRIDVAHHIAEDVPNVITGDASRLQQVLVNLLLNAVEFTDAGRVTLRVDGTPLAGGRWRIEFTVADTGIGIPPELQETIFEPFGQADPSATRRHGGTGLGLPIAARLCRMMGGELTVESEPGAGSTFRCSIEADAGPGIERDRDPHLAGRRALIIDDNLARRRTLRRWMSAWGMEPTPIGDLAEANDLLDGSYDVVVFGWVPGDERARRLIERWRGPVVEQAFPGSEPITPSKRVSPVPRPVRRKDLHAALLDAIAAPNRDEPGNGETVTTLRILLAEDNPVNQKVAQAFLARLGHRADTVANGLEALEALGQRPYDVVLMDVQMPEMDGVTATKRIRRVRKGFSQPHIIALTASAMPGDRERFIEAGMNDYLPKPLRLGDLAGALAQVEHRPEGGRPAVGLLDESVLETLLSETGEDAELVNATLIAYLEGLIRHRDAIDAADAVGDAERIGRVAHDLKSSSALVGATPLAALAEQLEEAAATGQPFAQVLDEIRDLIPQIRRAVEQVLQDAASTGQSSSSR